LNFKDKISRYFSYGELVLYRKDNNPSRGELVKLTQLCNTFLDHVRDVFGKTIVTSGYRNKKYNKAAGSRDTSQHMKGEAVDIYISNIDMRIVFLYIYENMDYDQLIFENVNGKIWIHVSWKLKGNRKSTLTYRDNEYKKYSGGLI